MPKMRAGVPDHAPRLGLTMDEVEYLTTPTGFPADGVVLADQEKSVDWVARRSSVIARAPDGVVRAVGGLVARLLA